MNDWIPVVAGFLIIVGALALARFAPNSVWGQELRRSFGARPTGPRGVRTRRDHLRSAALGGIAAVLLLGTMFAAAAIGQGRPDDDRIATIAMVYLFASFLLGAMALLSAVRSLWKAGRWRVELPDTPEHRRGLADAIDHLLDGGLSPDERAQFLDVVYLQPRLEQIRRATLKLARQYQAGVPDDYRAQIKQWTAGIRASAAPRE